MMMDQEFPIKIYHNPSCGISRNVLSAIEAAGYTPQIIYYLETGWVQQELKELLALANLTPRQALRETNSPAQELGLLASHVNDDTILEAMCTHPILVNRPFVSTPKGVKLCRPSESVLEMLDKMPQTPFYKEDGVLMQFPQSDIAAS